jgi:hypothetical protein
VGVFEVVFEVVGGGVWVTVAVFVAVGVIVLVGLLTTMVAFAAAALCTAGEASGVLAAAGRGVNALTSKTSAIPIRIAPSAISLRYDDMMPSREYSIA